MSLRTAVVHPSAIVHTHAKIDPTAEVGPFCVIGPDVSIASGTKLLANVVVNGHTKIGQDCRIYPFTSLGTASQDRKYQGELAYTTIGDRTTIREFCSINRASGEGETTSVGDDCLLLAYVHVAHNCRLGNGVTMSNLAQLAGHVVVEDHASIMGQAGVHQFVRIGAYSLVGGASKIVRDVPPFFLAEGNPAQVYGLNSVGLRRAAFSNDVMAELKACYKLIYHSGKNLSQAIEALREIVTTDEGRTLIAFIEATSDRGVMK